LLKQKIESNNHLLYDPVYIPMSERKVHSVIRFI
jgi:hypothetical protein